MQSERHLEASGTTHGKPAPGVRKDRDAQPSERQPLPALAFAHRPDDGADSETGGQTDGAQEHDGVVVLVLVFRITPNRLVDNHACQKTHCQACPTPNKDALLRSRLSALA